MLKTILFLGIMVSSIMAKDLGSVAGIKFGDDISRFEKIKDIECSIYKENKLKYCYLKNQKIIDNNQITDIYLYFNKNTKLYQVKFLGIEVKVTQVSTEDFDARQKELDVSKEFLNGLYSDNKKLIASTKASQQKVWYQFVDEYYKAYIFFYNKKMDKVVQKYKEQLKQEKSKKIKAKY